MISARFEADFSGFQAAVRDAEVSLKSFDTGVGRVESSLNRMVDSFSGRRTIQEATLMTEAIDRIGGASRLTDAEMGRVNRTVSDAIAKFTALGQQAPPAMVELEAATRRVSESSARIPGNFQRISDTAGGTTNAFGTLRAGITQADKTLGVFGLQIGPQIEALEELSGAAGKTASSIGAIGTAGLVVAAGIGGWQIGRAVAGFFDLDKTISQATARLMGWGDVAEQEAAAKTDTLAKASKIAGRDITDMGTALTIVTEHAKKHAKALEESAKKAEEHRKAHVAAIGELRTVGAGYETIVGRINSETVNQIKRYLELGEAQGSLAASQEALAEAYGLTLIQVKAITEAFTREQDAHKATAETIETVRKLYRDLETERIERSGTSTQRMRADIQAWFDDEVSKLDRSVANWRSHYDAIVAVANDRLAAVNINWNDIRDKSIASLQDTADRAKATYDYMVAHAGEFSAKTIAEYRKIADNATVAARDAADPWVEFWKQQDAFLAETDREIANFYAGVAAKTAAAGPSLGAAAQSATQPMVAAWRGSFTQIENAGRSMVSSLQATLAALHDTEVNRLATQFFGNVTDVAGAINRSRAPGIVRPFKNGGIVTRPTLALIGEQGPEAVVPLSGGGRAGGLTINVTVAPGLEGPGAAARTGKEIGDAVATSLRRSGIA